MKSFEMQVKVQKDGEEVWVSVKHSNQPEPYRYPDEKSARYMLKICYPDQHLLGGYGIEVRVVEVEHEPNMDEYPGERTPWL